MFQENKDENTRLPLPLTFGSLAIISLVLFILATVLGVMRRGGGIGEEERLVGVVDDVGILRKKSLFLNIFIVNWKPRHA